jgi:uncharacterized protein (DUF697 family)
MKASTRERISDNPLVRIVYFDDIEGKHSFKLGTQSTVGIAVEEAVGSAWIPIPGADVAAGAVTIWTMYGRINNKIGLSVKDNILKTIASGVLTNLTGYIAMSGVASALKFIPGIGSLGGALIMSASLYALTLASGYVYLKALCLLAEREGPNIDISKLGSAIKDILADEGFIKDFIKQAKKEYKNNSNGKETI